MNPPKYNYVKIRLFLRFKYLLPLIILAYEMFPKAKCSGIPELYNVMLGGHLAKSLTLLVVQYIITAIV